MQEVSNPLSHSRVLPTTTAHLPTRLPRGEISEVHAVVETRNENWDAYKSKGDKKGEPGTDIGVHNS